MPKDQQQWDMEAWSAGPAQETGDSKEQKELRVNGSNSTWVCRSRFRQQHEEPRKSVEVTVDSTLWAMASQQSFLSAGPSIYVRMTVLEAAEKTDWKEDRQEAASYLPDSRSRPSARWRSCGSKLGWVCWGWRGGDGFTALRRDLRSLGVWLDWGVREKRKMKAYTQGFTTPLCVCIKDWKQPKCSAICEFYFGGKSSIIKNVTWLLYEKKLIM